MKESPTLSYTPILPEFSGHLARVYVGAQERSEGSLFPPEQRQQKLAEACAAYQRTLQNGTTQGLMAHVDGKVIGFILYQDQEVCWDISDFYTLRYKKKPVGTHLLQEFCRRQQAQQTLKDITLLPLGQAKSIYKNKLGFEDDTGGHLCLSSPRANALANAPTGNVPFYFRTS